MHSKIGISSGCKFFQEINQNFHGYCWKALGELFRMFWVWCRFLSWLLLPFKTSAKEFLLFITRTQSSARETWSLKELQVSVVQTSWWDINSGESPGCDTLLGHFLQRLIRNNRRKWEIYFADILISGGGGGGSETLENRKYPGNMSFETPQRLGSKCEET